MDAGFYEASAFYQAGADICTVLGAAGIPTIRGVVEAADAHGKQAQVDLINVTDKATVARAAVAAGAHIIGIHTGLDAQAAGATPFVDLHKILDLGLGTRLSVAGGIHAGTVQQVATFDVDIIVIGAAIYGAASPATAAANIRRLLDAVVIL
jgi:3-hexulose-6-phosphate synthase